MQLIKMPTPTKTVQVKIPKRKHSRRWQKKYLKKFGTKVIILPHNPEDILFDEKRGITYAYPQMFQRLSYELQQLGRPPSLSGWF